MLQESEKGFSLIELVVVIVILGILAAVAIPRFVDLQSTTLNAVQTASAANVRSAFVLAVAQNKTEPTVAELATYVDASGSSAQAGGIQLVIDGTNYLVPTYTDVSCSNQTTATNQVVMCVGNISSS